MKYQSNFEKELGELIAPDNCRIELSEENKLPCLKLFAKNSKGKEYLLVKENGYIHFDGEKNLNRKWYDSKGNVHRDEKEGPAWIIGGDRERPIYHYMKHGKKHRETGPAIYCQQEFSDYYLNGKELSKKMWQECIANGGKLPNKPKRIELKKLKEIAAQLGEKARQSGMINGYQIEKDELPQLDYAAKVSCWKSHGTIDAPNCMIEYCLNCDPLDDTLRCYILVDSAGHICNSYLQIE